MSTSFNPCLAYSIRLGNTYTTTRTTPNHMSHHPLCHPLLHTRTMTPSNPYGSLSHRAPSQPIEHLVSNPLGPGLKTSASRVWSRCKSINRKSGSPVPPKEGQEVWKKGNERQVIDRDYELVPRIVSTHLTRSRTGNGLEPCYTGSSILSGYSTATAQPHEGTYHSLSSSATTKLDPNRLEYYSHPLFDATPNKYVPRNLPRRPNIHPKLSRGQIAKFRNASGSSSTSTDEGTFLICSCPVGACRDRGGTLNSITTAQSRQGVPVRLFSTNDAGTAVSASLSSSTVTTRQSDSSSTPRQNKSNIPPIESQTRRHLASSRSTAEMKGRSPTTPNSTPRARQKSRPTTTSSITSNVQSFETSTPRPLPQSGQGNEVRFPYACPDRLIQRSRTSPFKRPYSSDNPLPEDMSPTFMRPRPAPKPQIPEVQQRPLSSPDSDTIAGLMEYESTCALTPPTPGPIDTETLERLFDEVLQACRTGDIPYKSSENSSTGSLYSVDLDSTPAPKPAAGAGNLRARLDWDVPANSDTAPVDVPVPASPHVKAGPPRVEKPKMKDESTKRFIPSGRSFEPLRSVSIPNVPMSTGSSNLGAVGKGFGAGSGSRSRVKEAIAKFENATTSPTTPLRGEFSNR
jgi:hypothetical protein